MGQNAKKAFEDSIKGDFVPNDFVYYCASKSDAESIRENGFDMSIDNKESSSGRGVCLGEDKTGKRGYDDEFLTFKIAEGKKIAIMEPVISRKSAFSAISHDPDMRLRINEAFEKYGIHPAAGNISLVQDYMIKKLADRGYSGVYMGYYINIFDPADLRLQN